MQNTELTLKDNIDYLGNGVNMRHMTEKAREHFEMLQTRHQISGADEELKVSPYFVKQIGLTLSLTASSDHHFTGQNK